MTAADNENINNNNGVNWLQVITFLLLTFALTWILDLALWQYIKQGGKAGFLMALQLQMLLPAFSAILLGLFVYKNSPIHRSHYKERPRIFYYLFLVYTLISIGLTISIMLLPGQAMIISVIGSVINIVGLIALIVIRALSSSQDFAKVGLSGGKVKDWIIYGLAFILFYTAQTALNAIFKLGQPVDQASLLDQLTAGQGDLLPMNIFLALSFFQSVLIGPLLGLLMAFGEEFGWRGYLQGELIKLGKIRGIFLLGFIWGVWHYPVIWMGHNYPGQPIWGTFLMTAYTILLGFVLGYVMLKTKAIWLVAFLHAMNNQVFSYLTVIFYRPDSQVFSFGIGIYGVLSLIPIVLLLLRDPIWKTPIASPPIDDMSEL